MATDPSSSAPADLLVAAIDRFGRDGFEGASTRAIAAAVGRPMSAITYHFGGKQGLYLAAARHIAQEMSGRFAQALGDKGLGAVIPVDPQSARGEIDTLLRAAVTILTCREIESFARFILREQMDPTEAFAILYEGAMQPLFLRFVMLLRVVVGPKLPDHELRLRATMMMGEILMFRVCRAAVLRNMGWSDIGPAECEDIVRGARRNVDAVLQDLCEGGVS